MSFGATDTIFQFLEQHAVLNMQLLNRWMYAKGISRVQRKWRGAWKVGVAILTTARINSFVTRYDGLLGDAELCRGLGSSVDFRNCQVVQVKSDLYTVNERNLSITRYANFTDDDSRHCSIKKLASHDVRRDACSATSHRDWAIYVTGGVGSDSSRLQHRYWGG